MGNNAMNALYTQRKKNTDNLYEASDFNGEACKTQASLRPGDHLHLKWFHCRAVFFSTFLSVCSQLFFKFCTSLCKYLQAKQQKRKKLTAALLQSSSDDALCYHVRIFQFVNPQEKNGPFAVRDNFDFLSDPKPLGKYL